MKKFVLLLLCLISLSVSSYAAQDYKSAVIKIKNEIKKQKELEKGYEIYTKAYNWNYDPKTKNYIIPEDVNNLSVNVVFEKDGRVIKFSDKIIKYKNGKFSQIGDKYVTYLNGKVYKIGNDKVELDSSGRYIDKIGNKSLQEYFIGTKFTKKDVVGSNYVRPGMIFTVCADGSDFGGTFTDIYIPFQVTPVSEGHYEPKSQNIITEKTKYEPQIKRIGGESVEYNLDGTIKRIGDKWVQYR